MSEQNAVPPIHLSNVCGGRKDSQYVVKNDVYDDLVSFSRFYEA